MADFVPGRAVIDAAQRKRIAFTPSSHRFNSRLSIHNDKQRTPISTLVEKLYAVHNINSLIPDKLDLAESNYSIWSYFFKGHCSNFGVLKHIEEPVTEASTTRTISLKGELRVIQMGDQTADEYFSKIEAILTLLTDLGSDMSDDDVVTYAINGLSDKYGSLAQIIAHKDPFPDLATVR
ncbi:hypothetical protein Tco_0824975 [Tanacetum coccineum]